MKSGHETHRMTLLLAVVLIGLASAAGASELSKTTAAIQARKVEQLALRKTEQQAQRELASTKKQLVSNARRLRKIEHQQANLDEELAEIQRSIKTTNAKLEGSREELKLAVEAAIRLSRMPPEAAVMLPELGQQAMMAQVALKVMTESMQRLSSSLAGELGTLGTLQQRAKDKHKRIKRLAGRLGDQRTRLSELAKQRRHLYTQTKSKSARTDAQIKRLAKKAKSLRELVTSIENSTRTKPNTIKSQAIAVIAKPANGKLRSFKRARGRIKPPVVGRIKTHYGDSNALAEKSKGIVIAAPASASVTAPYDAEVVYTGAFRSFGRMVILRHADGFHTLVAGLKNINAKQGEFLLEGEPIGAMGTHSNSRQLYVELRKNNQPINPAKWLAGL